VSRIVRIIESEKAVVVLKRFEDMCSKLAALRNEHIQAWREECDLKCDTNLKKPLFTVKGNKQISLNFDPQVKYTAHGRITNYELNKFFSLKAL
jgi:Dynein heavy chain, N-terminal region 1